MNNVVYLHAPRPRALNDAYALKDVEYLRELCRKVRIRTRCLTLEQRIAIGERLDPELMAKLEDLVRRLDRKA